ncbi:MAG: tetratricopeptide repeat protein [Chlorobi bacterium]|nr:tetratricopeptide repeat protein [Chlorobiota bacterium]
MKLQKLFILIFAVLFTGNQNFAQKLKKERLVVYKYIQLPTDPLPENYKSYILSITSEDPYIADEIYSHFNLVGFNKKKSGTSEFVIEVTDYPFQYTTKKNIRDKKVTKDGKTTVTRYYSYSYNIKYKLSSRMTNLDGEEIFSTVADISKTGRASESTSSSQAYKNCIGYIKQYKDKRAVTATSKLNKTYNNKFGYPEKTNSLVIFKVKPKKFEYDDFEEAYNIAVEAAKIIKNDMDATGKCMEAYVPAIQIWEKALEESDITKKKTRVNKNVTCACYYNMGNAYLLCKNYDKAIENFNKVLDIDKKFSNTDVLLRFAKDMKRRTEANI